MIKLKIPSLWLGIFCLILISPTRQIVDKSKGLKTLLKKQNGFVLSDEQIKLLDKERELHLGGQSKSYTREEAMQIVRKQHN